MRGTLPGGADEWVNDAGSFAIAGSLWLPAPELPGTGLEPIIACDGWLEAPPVPARDRERMVADYHGDSQRFALHYPGDFAFALFDRVSQRLVLSRDAVGARPLYYAEHAGVVCFASQIRAVLAALPDAARPALGAVAELLRSRVNLSPGETLFEGVSAVPPAHSLVIGRMVGDLVKHWEARGDEWAHLKTFEECTEAFRSLLQQAVQRRAANGRLAVFVSGGLDSSALFCNAAAAGLDPLGIYYGATDGSPADETRYVRQLRAHGEVREVAFEPYGYPELISESVSRGEFPLADDLPGPLHRAHQLAADSGASVIMSGTWADQVLFPFPPPYLIDLLHGIHLAEALQHARAYPRWLSDVPPGEVWEAVLRMIAREHIPTSVLRLRWKREKSFGAASLLAPELRALTQPPVQRIDRWAAQTSRHARAIESNVRSRFDVLTMEWVAKAAAGYGLQSAHPFLDRDLLTFLVSAPAALQTRDGVPKALLRSALQGTVPAAILQRRDKGDYSAPVHAAITTALPQLLERLRAGTAARSGYLDLQRLAPDLASISQLAQIPHADVPTALSALFAFECWLESLFEPGASHETNERRTGAEAG